MCNVLLSARCLSEASEWLAETEHTARTVGLPIELLLVRQLRARYERLTGTPERALEIYTDLTVAGSPLPPLELA
jgi:hypothetical protein